MRVTVERLGHHGDGIAAGPIYVDGALPNEVAEGDVANERMVAPRIISHAPERVEPACPHYGACGGCQVMHASDPFVSAWKAGIIRQAMTARGLPAPIKGIATSPPGSRRRAVFSGRRTKGTATLGFHARRSFEIVETPDCRVVTPALNASRPTLRRLVGIVASRKGEVSIAVADSASGLDVAMTGGRPLDRKMAEELVDVAGSGGLARLTVDGETVFQAAEPVQNAAGTMLFPPPGAFLQATRHGESALIACVSRVLEEARHVADLFAGCGTFSLPLSRRATVHAVEGDAAMSDATRTAWRHAQNHCSLTVETRDLFKDPLTRVELSRFDATVVDPPRAGAEAQTHEIAASSIGTVAAVSCNPVTFARDAQILLAAGFGLNWIRVVDQFRWSTHVELVAEFRR